MESETQARLDTRHDPRLEDWHRGTIGGVLGSIAFGVLMAIQTPNVLEVAIPSLYGLEGGIAGTAVHLMHGLILGVVFAMVLTAVGWTTPKLAPSIAVGVGYGLVVWISLAAIVMPIWLAAVGFALAPDVPNITIESVFGHIAYGTVLGAVYALLGR